MSNDNATCADAMMCTPDPGQVEKFFLAAWIGAQSKEFSLSPIGADGTAQVKIELCKKDPNTLKFAVVYNSYAPLCTRVNNLTSHFIDISELLNFMAEAPKLQSRASADATSAAFPSSLRVFSLKDNFSKHKAFLRFVSINTPSPEEISKLELSESAMHSLDRINGAIEFLGQTTKSQISQCAVSPLNAGPQYMEGFTYGQMQDCLSHYAILGHAFSAMSTPVDLSWIMYDAYQAVQSTGIHPSALMAMSDVDFVMRFGLPMITQHTGCALSSTYCTDYTLNAVGTTCKVKETEDIAKTYSKLALETQRLSSAGAKPWVSKLSPSSKPSLGQCLSSVADAQSKRRAGGPVIRQTPNIFSDDCENAVQGITAKGKGLSQLFATTSPGSLVGMMNGVARSDKRFSKITPANNLALAPVVMRYGELFHNGTVSVVLGVVSAKGPAYTELGPGAPGALSGHGTGIVRIKDSKTGLYVHTVAEGTTYLGIDPPVPAGYASSICLRLPAQQPSSPGETIQSFDTATLGTLMGQTIHRLVGVSVENCILAHMKSDYSSNPDECPFYVAAFYTGLGEGGASLGCIPLDTNPPDGFMAGSKPLFGAPVLGLSNHSTMAISITPDMLSSSGSVEEGEEIANLIKAQVSEAWSPEADPKTIAVIGSYWQPCESPDSSGIAFRTPGESARWIRSENTWAFDNPDQTTHAVHLYSQLAERFNALQAGDPESDGSRLHAFGKYLSACLRMSFPIPRVSAHAQPMSLSFVRNLKKASTEIGASKLAACPLKMAHINARAKVESTSHFYMCDQGNGPVHAHRVVLG